MNQRRQRRRISWWCEPFRYGWYSKSIVASPCGSLESNNHNNQPKSYYYYYYYYYIVFSFEHLLFDIVCCVVCAQKKAEFQRVLLFLHCIFYLFSILRFFYSSIRSFFIIPLTLPFGWSTEEEEDEKKATALSVRSFVELASVCLRACVCVCAAGRQAGTHTTVAFTTSNSDKW